MSDPRPYLWLIPVLPLAASVLTAFMAVLPSAPGGEGGVRGFLRRQSHWPCILGAAGACVLSLLVLASVYHHTHELADEGTWATAVAYYPWFRTGDLDIGFTLRADPLTAVMLVTVTFISTLIAIYSAGYMHGDEGYARFFAEVALFIFSMTGLVLADNFLVLYGFWEGVGLCSFLLIGFWFTKPSAAAAARKAFLVTRLGDLGLFLGILLLWFGFGYNLNYEKVFQAAPEHPNLVTAACLLLFCGAVGKSAQFPLYVWLPDAMEGPTPVSALIHAATMVTAGVYLVARCAGLFMLSPVAQLVVACIGAFTALLAALIALTQNDLKRVLAYSTISQLGYMFLALGCGAMVAGIFHLFTHAFFKALLFLAAGSVMHAMGNVIDMRRFGGLRHVLKVTHLTFVCGAAALAAVPLFSGFWSKDEILSAALTAGGSDHPYAGVYLLLLAVGVLTAGLTAFYTFRAYFLTFWGEERFPPEAGGHAHESPPVMLVPLIVLAFGAVFAGYVNAEPLTGWLGHFLDRTPYFLHPGAIPETKAWLLALSTAVSLGGIALAWWMYVRQPGLATRLADSMPGLYQWSLNKFYVDEFYYALVVRPLEICAAICRVFDLNLLDGLVDLIGHLPGYVGQVFRPIQNGLVQFYALAMVAGFTVFLIALAQLIALVAVIIAVTVGLIGLLLYPVQRVVRRTT